MRGEGRRIHATRILLYFIAVAAVAIAAISSFSAVYAAASPNQNNSMRFPNTGTPVVQSHRVTATELRTMITKLGITSEGQNCSEIVDGYGTGLRAPTTSEWQEISNTAQVTDTVTIVDPPAIVDNSLLPWFPPVGNQGSEGSCVAFSVGYYVKTFQEAKEHSWDLSAAAWGGSYPGYPTPTYQDKIMSPEFLYHLINGGTNAGGSLQRAANIVCAIGISSWQKMPYSQEDHVSWPSEQAWAEAPYYRGNASGYQYLTLDSTSGTQNLKNLLAAGTLVSIGIDGNFFSKLTTSDFWTLDNYTPANASSINHANTIIGYDDTITYQENGTLHRGAFKIVNSWGKGGWEHVADGFYWISYEAMRQRVGSTSNGMFFYDLIGYKPELMATFKISHPLRGYCQVTVGVGNTTSPITTKRFTQYIVGGNFSFPQNNMMLDITEFKNKLPQLTNQTYFLMVRDAGTSTTGTVTNFSIGNAISTETPKNTINNNTVYLTLYCSTDTAELLVSPTSGPPGTPTTLTGSGFAPSRSVNISYLNPLTLQWTSIINNTATNAQGQFKITLNAPDLMQSIKPGEHPETSDPIVFRATDNGNWTPWNASVPFVEWRRGITLVGGSAATEFCGNNTDLTNRVAVVSHQPLSVEGKGFSPGNVTLIWDGLTDLGTSLADDTGSFKAVFIVPPSTAGRHEIILKQGEIDFHTSISRLPTTLHDYDGMWHNADFTINLTSDAVNSTTQYRINGGQIRNVISDGQPRITKEGDNNTLEFWSVDEFGNEEAPHKKIAQIKLDKIAPCGSLQINSGANYTNTPSVTLTLTARDASSGVKQVRFSNNGIWDSEPWEAVCAKRNWTLTPGDGQKTVRYQIIDNSGLLASYQTSVVLDTKAPSVNLSSNQPKTAGSAVVFEVSQCEDSSGIISSIWDFGDGTTANGTSTTHAYSNAGSYVATLTVTDFAGNIAATNMPITVQNNASRVAPEFAIFVLPLVVATVANAVAAKRKNLAEKE